MLLVVAVASVDVASVASVAAEATLIFSPPGILAFVSTDTDSFMVFYYRR